MVSMGAFSLETASDSLLPAGEEPGPAHRTAPPTSGVQGNLSWESLYQRHADFVWRNLKRMGVHRHDAMDTMHDVFLIVHQRLHTFDAAKGTERSWLFGIAANVARARLRKRRPLLIEDAEQVIPSESRRHHGTPGAFGATAAITDSLEIKRLREGIESAVASLDLEHRAVFVMFEVEGLGCVAISDELGVPVGTIYSRLHNARRQLRAALLVHAPNEVGKP
jgi:RNA polymerase sigma-70 factor, ECF subfamily